MAGTRGASVGDWRRGQFGHGNHAQEQAKYQMISHSTGALVMCVTQMVTTVDSGSLRQKETSQKG